MPASLAGMLPPACRPDYTTTRASTSRWSAQPCNTDPGSEAFAGVDAVVLSEDAVTVEKQPSHEWCDLEEPVRYAITTAMSGMQATPEGVAPAMDDDAMFDTVVEIFRVEINPAIASHGGAVELIDVQDGTVVLRMQGGCQGCGMANVTLRQGIEGTLRRALPSLKGIQDVTDHTAGTDPYFSSAKT